jgi:aspartyl/glutamyl-tRNA(Asn/Gln) amidotransferase C subunit
MAIDEATARRVAHLARIAVDEADLPALAAELSGILSFVEELEAVDVEGVEPMTAVRRGSQNPRCMPRCGLPRKSNRNSIVANDDNYALAA